MARAVAPRVTKVPEIRKGDTILVLGGKDAGKRGTVERVDRPLKLGTPYRVVVQGLNIAKRHTKPRPRMNQNDRVPQMQQGGIVEKPLPMPWGRSCWSAPAATSRRASATSSWRAARASEPAAAVASRWR